MGVTTDERHRAAGYCMNQIGMNSYPYIRRCYRKAVDGVFIETWHEGEKIELPACKVCRSAQERGKARTQQAFRRNKAQQDARISMIKKASNYKKLVDFIATAKQEIDKGNATGESAFYSVLNEMHRLTSD